MSKSIASPSSEGSHSQPLPRHPGDSTALPSSHRLGLSFRPAPCRQDAQRGRGAGPRGVNKEYEQAAGGRAQGQGAAHCEPRQGLESTWPKETRNEDNGNLWYQGAGEMWPAGHLLGAKPPARRLMCKLSRAFTAVETLAPLLEVKKSETGIGEVSCPKSSHWTRTWQTK